MINLSLRLSVFRSSLFTPLSTLVAHVLLAKRSHELFATPENALFHPFAKAWLTHQLSGKFSQYHVLLIVQRDLPHR